LSDLYAYFPASDQLSQGVGGNLVQRLQIYFGHLLSRRSAWRNETKGMAFPNFLRPVGTTISNRA